MSASFNIDRDDARLYERVPINACVNAVAQLARDPVYNDVAAIQSAISDRLLETRVQKALVEGLASTETATISVVAAQGRIILDGVCTRGSLPLAAEDNCPRQ
jgi:osmotically-inducible protein OsmY